MRQTRPNTVLAHLGLLALAALTACSDSSGPPDPSNNPPADPGSVEVTVATTGDNVDPDGYTVKVGSLSKAVAANGSVTIDGVPAGNAAVLLDGIANNCSVGGGNPHAVTIASGAKTTLSLTVTCSATVGTVTVTTKTTGQDLDADGYTVALDGGSPQAIGANGTATLAGVAMGNRQVTIEGIAANCRLTGDKNRPVAVPQGGTVAVAYEIACLALPTARDSAFTGSEGQTITIDLAKLTDAKGVSGAALAIGTSSNPAFTATLSGSVVTISSADGKGNGKVNVPFTLTTDAGTASAVLKGDIAGMTDFEITLKEVFGDSVITSAASIEIDGTSYDFVNGVVSGKLTPGMKTVKLVSNAATYDADNLSMSTGGEYVLFPKYSQASVDFTQDFTAVIRRPSKADAAFDLGHFLATYDNATAHTDVPFVGMQAPRSKNLTIYIQTQGLVPFPGIPGNCMAPNPFTGQMTQLRALQDRIAANLAGTYSVTKAEGATPPSGSGVLTICVTSNATAINIRYDAAHQNAFDGGVLLVNGTTATSDAVLNQLGNGYPFGAVNEDSQCRVASIFQDAVECSSNPENGSPTVVDATANDKHEGAVMGYWYARPAAAKRVATNGATPFFSLR